VLAHIGYACLELRTFNICCFERRLIQHLVDYMQFFSHTNHARAILCGQIMGAELHARNRTTQNSSYIPAWAADEATMMPETCQAQEAPGFAAAICMYIIVSPGYEIQICLPVQWSNRNIRYSSGADFEVFGRRISYLNILRNICRLGYLYQCLHIFPF